MDLYSFLDALGPARDYVANPAEPLSKRIVPLLVLLAEPEYRAASIRLEQIRSSDLASKVRTALASLEAAYRRFYAAAEEAGPGGFVRKFRRFFCEYLLFGFGSPCRKLDNYRKAMEAGLFIAVCYRALNQPTDVAEWVRRSVHCFEQNAGINVDREPVDPQVTLDGVRYEHKLERELRQQRWKQRQALLRFGGDLIGTPIAGEKSDIDKPSEP